MVFAHTFELLVNWIVQTEGQFKRVGEDKLSPYKSKNLHVPTPLTQR